MQVPETSRQLSGPSSSQHRRGWLLALIVLGVFWLEFFNELRGEWDVNAQYSYGYVVPLLGAMLLWRRWQDRPAGTPSTGRGPAVLAGIIVLALLPVRVVLEANPEWRLIYWAHGAMMLGLSYCLIQRAGGWPWVKYFFPPLLFMLVAVPWPLDSETKLIQGLMRGVAAVTVEVVNWMGIPAIQHGNLIEVGTGIVGINEACSGVRSLQSALMLSLFLGELYRFTAARRTVLLVASILAVLVANVTRTSFLTWAAAERGLTQMEAWHDRAGEVVMFIILPVLFGLAWLLRPKAGSTPPEPAAPAPMALPSLPRAGVIGALVWLIAVEFMTNAWYSVHEKNLIATPRWSVAWPSANGSLQLTSVPAESLATLRCTDSESANWEDADGNHWSAFFLRWKAGKNSEQLARGHRPDICFPAAGANLVADLGEVDARVNGVTIPFKHQTFESKSGVMEVFYCLWSDHVSPHEQGINAATTWHTRLQAVVDGRRNLGQQVLEVVINGTESDAAAVDLFQQKLPGLVRLD